MLLLVWILRNCVIVKFGARYCSVLTSSICWRSSSSPGNTEREIGTSCDRSSRRCAVTRISSRIGGFPPAAGGPQGGSRADDGPPGQPTGRGAAAAGLLAEPRTL